MMIVETTASLSTVPAVVTVTNTDPGKQFCQNHGTTYSPNDSFNKSYNLVLVAEKVIGKKETFFH